MTAREYRQDDQTIGYCPVCHEQLSNVTEAARGYCELHGWVYADWQQHETFKQAVGDLFHKMQALGDD